MLSRFLMIFLIGSMTLFLSAWLFWSVQGSSGATVKVETLMKLATGCAVISLIGSALQLVQICYSPRIKVQLNLLAVIVLNVVMLVEFFRFLAYLAARS